MKLLSIQTLHNTPEEKRIVLTCFAAACVAGISSQTLGVVLPNLRESYQLSYELSGLLISAQSVGTMTANIVSGLLPLLLGRKRSVLALTCWLMLGAVILLLTGNPLLLMAAGFMIGLSRGGAINFGNVTVGIYGADKTRSMNLAHACFAVGALSAPFSAMFFSAIHWWKGALAVIGILGAILVFLYWTMPLPADRNPSARSDTVPVPNISSRRPYLRSRRFWTAGFILLFYIAAEYGISGWLVTYFKESGLLSGALSQFMSSLLWAAILIGRLTCATMAGKIQRHKLLILSGAGFVTFLVLLLLSSSPFLIVVGIFGFGFFMAGIYPSTLAEVNEEIGGSDLAMSILVTMGGIGGIGMPAAIGYLSERTGITGGMWLLVAVAAATLAMILYNGYLQRQPSRIR